MEDKALQAGEYGSGVATVAFFISVIMEWLNENHFAVISMCAILTAISTVIFGFLRHRLQKIKLNYEMNKK